MLSLEKDKTIFLKQKKMMDLMANGMSKDEAMMEIDYQEALQESPEAVLETDAWQITMAKYLPDESLAMKHSELLNKRDRNGEIDTPAVVKALEMAYKLKGKFIDRLDVTSDGKQLPANITFNFKKKEDSPVVVDYKPVENAVIEN